MNIIHNDSYTFYLYSSDHIMLISANILASWKAGLQVNALLQYDIAWFFLMHTSLSRLFLQVIVLTGEPLNIQG